MSKLSPKIDTQVAEELGVPGAINLDEAEKLLAQKFNDLINTDFNQLVQLLYRIDIDEMKLRELLKKNEGKDTGLLLAQLAIERQIQKITARKQFNKSDDAISDEEKW